MGSISRIGVGFPAQTELRPTGRAGALSGALSQAGIEDEHEADHRERES
jgi:hypothetical protein